MSATLHDCAGPDVPQLAEDEAEVVDDVVAELLDLDRVDRDILRRRMGYAKSDDFFMDTREYEPPRLDLPGFGERYTEEDGCIPCGEEIPHFCEGCGHTTAVGRTCSRSVCPRCGSNWVQQTAEGHVARLDEAARMMSSRDGNQAVYKHHGVISPPPDFMLDSDDPLNDMMHAIRGVLNAIGAEGFVYYHPWAGKGSGETGGADATPHGNDDDRGEWKSRLFADRSWSDVRDELAPRPHFHVVVCTPHFPGGDVTKAIYQQTGWVIHRITQRNGSAVSLGDLGDVARAVTYALSHTGIDTDGDRNQAAFRAYGTAVHDCCPTNESTNRKAHRAVAHAVPDTLGIPSGDVECHAEVPEDQAELDEFTDGDGDGLDDDLGMVRCGRSLVAVDDADEYLDDDDWCDQALYVDELRDTYAEWQEAGGWKGYDPPDAVG